MPERLGGPGIAGGPLDAGMEEIGHFATELVERAVETCVEGVVVLEELLNECFPYMVGQGLGMLFLGTGQHALGRQYLSIDVLEIVGGVSRFPRHRVPHLE